MPDWHTGKWLNNGICNLIDEGGILRRELDVSYVDELRHWQNYLNRVTALDADPFSDPVELEDVIDAARRHKATPDKNWS